MHTFDRPTPRQFNVFSVTWLSPGTFLGPVIGLDLVKIAPGSTSEIHRHNSSDNLVYILSGHGAVSLDGLVSPVEPGLRISIPRGVAHGFKCGGEELVFVSAQIPPILDEKSGVLDRDVIVPVGEW